MACGSAAADRLHDLDAVAALERMHCMLAARDQLFVDLDRVAHLVQFERREQITQGDIVGKLAGFGVGRTMSILTWRDGVATSVDLDGKKLEGDDETP